MVSSAKLEASPQQPPQAAAAPVPAKKIHYPFWFGGSASCFAAAVTHPLDLGKFFSFGALVAVLNSMDDDAG